MRERICLGVLVVLLATSLGCDHVTRPTKSQCEAALTAAARLHIEAEKTDGFFEGAAKALVAASAGTLVKLFPDFDRAVAECETEWTVFHVQCIRKATTKAGLDDCTSPLDIFRSTKPEVELKPKT